MDTISQHFLVRPLIKAFVSFRSSSGFRLTIPFCVTILCGDLRAEIVTLRFDEGGDDAVTMEGRGRRIGRRWVVFSVAALAAVVAVVIVNSLLLLLWL